MDSIQTNNSQPPVQPTQAPAPKSKSPIIITILGIIAAVGVFASFAAKNAKDTDKENTPSIPPSKNTPEKAVNDVTTIPETKNPAVTPTEQTYKDGTYQADGTYQSPAGQEQVQLSITLKDGIVTDSTFSATSENPKSKMFQGIFTQNYKSQVVGKKISDIHLTEVSGSSLTPIGFNDALTKIEAQAKS